MRRNTRGLNLPLSLVFIVAAVGTGGSAANSVHAQPASWKTFKAALLEKKSQEIEPVLQTGHTDDVAAVVFSPNGTLRATLDQTDYSHFPDKECLP